MDSFDELTQREKSEILEYIPAKELLSDFQGQRERLLKIISKEKYALLCEKLKDTEYLSSLLYELEKKGIFCITRLSADFPSDLSLFPANPVLFYCMGNGELLKKRKFAVVGSRKTVPWARALTERISAALSEHFVIVTGIAEGGDAAAIKGALHGGKGANLICVLPYGLDWVYPRSHASLLKEIAREGLLITEHKPSVKAQKFLFPVRNRIIAELSEGVLVVGAAKRSGAAITARYAAEYGKDVFAVPYNPGIKEGEGCNALLKLGALLTESEEDILSYYGLEYKTQKNDVSQEEQRILDVLRENGELHVEKLAAALTLPVYVLSGTLSGLEVKGLVVRSGGNRYSVVGK